MNFDTILGKSIPEKQTLFNHLKQTLEVGIKLFDFIPLENRKYYRELLAPVFIFHDLGKILKPFQDRLEGKKVENFRHEIFSQLIASKFLYLNFIQLFGILYHHKEINTLNINNFITLYFEPTDDLEPIPCYVKELNRTKDFILSYLQYLQKHFSTYLSFEINLDEKQKGFDHNIEQLEEYSEYRLKNKSFDREEAALVRALLLTSDHLASGNNTELTKISAFGVQEITQNNKFKLRAFQKKFLDANGSFLLLAPTGSGKTEAALCWILRNRTENARIFYTLPYIASINAMYKRLDSIFRANVTAMHSNNLSFFFYQMEAEESNYKKNAALAKNLSSLSKELFHQCKICTPHQLLRYVLFGKGWELGLIDFKQGIFIFDEFHVYNPLLTGLMIAMAKLMQDYFAAHLFFVSATIPDFLHKELVKELSLTFVTLDNKEASDREILEQKRHKLICKRSSLSDQLEAILQHKGKRLVVCNNVKTAQNIYSELKDRMTGEVLLLHGQLTFCDRKKVEDRLSNRSLPDILVATQAVEVSLDIDFDILFTELAPIDALIQRFGRVNRKALKPPCHVIVLLNILGNVPFYADAILEKTQLELLKYHKTILVESDLNTMCSAVYNEGWDKQGWEDYRRGLKNSTIKNFKNHLFPARSYSWIDTIIEGSTSLEVIPKNLYADYCQLIENGEYIRANDLFIRVHIASVRSKSYFTEVKKRNILILNKKYKSGFGLEECTEEDDNGLHFL